MKYFKRNTTPNVEVPGIEPGASCMLSTRSTTELHPLVVDLAALGNILRTKQPFKTWNQTQVHLGSPSAIQTYLPSCPGPRPPQRSCGRSPRGAEMTNFLSCLSLLSPWQLAGLRGSHAVRCGGTKPGLRLPKRRGEMRGRSTAVAAGRGEEGRVPCGQTPRGAKTAGPQGPRARSGSGPAEVRVRPARAHRPPPSQKL